MAQLSKHYNANRSPQELGRAAGKADLQPWGCCVSNAMLMRSGALGSKLSDAKCVLLMV